MFKDFDVNKIDKVLKDKFDIIFDFEFDGLLLLLGGSVKDIIMGKENIKDLDFSLLTTSKGNIQEFIKKYKLKCKKNIYHGYKINYNGIEVDMTYINDLYDAGHFSTDYLFYDVKRKILIPIGIKKSVKKNTIIDYYYQGYFRPKKRLIKAKEFIKYMNNKKFVKVKYKYNRLFYVIKSFILHPNKLFKRSDINVK